jgi:hypothetical protein
MKQTRSRFAGFGVAVLASTLTAFGQHGAAGGHAAGGFSAPRSFSMSAPAAAPRSFRAPSYRPVAPNQLRSSYTSPIGAPPFGGTQPITGDHGVYGRPAPWRERRPVYGPGAYLIPSYIGYGYGSYGYLDDSGYAYQPSDAQPPVDMNAQAAPMQSNDNSRQVYAEAPESAPYSAQNTEPVPDQPAITVLFKDGRSQQIQNYALTKTTLYVFDGPRRREIPLDEIDLPQTEKTNRDAGLDFEVPAGAE